jgi:hypothetical protein
MSKAVGSGIIRSVAVLAILALFTDGGGGSGAAVSGVGGGGSTTDPGSIVTFTYSLVQGEYDSLLDGSQPRCLPGQTVSYIPIRPSVPLRMT